MLSWQDITTHCHPQALFKSIRRSVLVHPINCKLKDAVLLLLGKPCFSCKEFRGSSIFEFNLSLADKMVRVSEEVLLVLSFIAYARHLFLLLGCELWSL